MASITEIKRVKLSDIRPYERNAKIHGPEQIEKLKKSITEFGFVNPCLIDRDYNLIAGHGRVMAAESLGMEDVPCVFVEGLTDAQRRAYILADNKLAELAEWNNATLAEELAELTSEGFNIDFAGFEVNIHDDDFPSLDELNDADENNNRVVVRLVFDNFKEYHTNETEIKELADRIGCGMTVGK